MGDEDVAHHAGGRHRDGDVGAIRRVQHAPRAGARARRRLLQRRARAQGRGARRPAGHVRSAGAHAVAGARAGHPRARVDQRRAGVERRRAAGLAIAHGPPPPRVADGAPRARARHGRCSTRAASCTSTSSRAGRARRTARSRGSTPRPSRLPPPMPPSPSSPTSSPATRWTACTSTTRAIPTTSSTTAEAPSRRSRPTSIESLADQARRQQERALGSDLLAWTEAYPERWTEFRRHRLTALVTRLRESVKARRPGLVFSAAVAPGSEGGQQPPPAGLGDVARARPARRRLPDGLRHRLRDLHRAGQQRPPGGRPAAGVGRHRRLPALVVARRSRTSGSRGASARPASSCSRTTAWSASREDSITSPRSPGQPSSRSSPMPGFPRARRGRRPVHRGPCRAVRVPWKWERPAVRCGAPRRQADATTRIPPPRRPTRSSTSRRSRRCWRRPPWRCGSSMPGRLEPRRARGGSASACWRGARPRTRPRSRTCWRTRPGCPATGPYYETLSGRAPFEQAICARTARVPAGHCVRLQRPRLHPPRFRARGRRRRAAERPGSRLPLATIGSHGRRCGSACRGAGAARLAPTSGGPGPARRAWTTATPRRWAAWPATRACSARRAAVGAIARAILAARVGAADAPTASVARHRAPVHVTRGRRQQPRARLGHDASHVVLRRRGCQRRPSATPASRARRCGLIPVAGLYVVLLTNRVYPTPGSPEGIAAFRRALHDAVMEDWAAAR